MAYWCDDQGLNLDQRRRDAEQERILQKWKEEAAILIGARPEAASLVDDLRIGGGEQPIPKSEQSVPTNKRRSIVRQRSTHFLPGKKSKS